MTSGVQSAVTSVRLCSFCRRKSVSGAQVSSEEGHTAVSSMVFKFSRGAHHIALLLIQLWAYMDSFDWMASGA